MANPVNGDSDTAATPAVSGVNTASGDGVSGTGRRGVVGISTTFQGVYGWSNDNAGVVGESGDVHGHPGMHGVFGMGHNPHGAGVYGTNDAVGGFGVQGVNERGDGVVGDGRRGVVGTSTTYQGVYGWSNDNAGVVGESQTMHGVFGVCHAKNGAGIFGTNDDGFGLQGISQTGVGIVATSGNIAGLFEGNVVITGKLTVGKYPDVISDLVKRIEALEARPVMTVNGATPSPPERPKLKAESVVPGRVPGVRLVTLSGSGYEFGRTVNLHICHPESVDLTVVGLTWLPDGKGGGRLVGYDEEPATAEIPANETIVLRAEQGLKDINDTSGILWSENVIIL